MPALTEHLSPARAILLLSFAESLAAILLERGVYFYTHDILGLSERHNLLLAAAFGVAYVGGALLSQATAARLGERRLLVLSIALLLGVHLTLSSFPTAGVLSVAFPLIGLLQGIKWPVVESFVSAGRAPAELVATVGRFNVTWAASVPVALVISGPLIESGWPSALFVFSAACNVLALAACAVQPTRPRHLDASHPTRPSDAQLSRLAALLGASRWSMLLSYALLFLLAPLLPGVLERLGLGVSAGTQVAAVLDGARLVTFWALGLWSGWQGRAWPLILTITVLPFSFLLTLFGGSVAAVITGELIFGTCAGLLYAAALYYALVIKNAAVEAGGAHESLIGLGFVLGPLAGLSAQWLEPSTGGRTSAVVLSLSPMCLACTGLALSCLRARRKLVA